MTEPAGEAARQHAAAAAAAAPGPVVGALASDGSGASSDPLDTTNVRHFSPGGPIDFSIPKPAPPSAPLKQGPPADAAAPTEPTPSTAAAPGTKPARPQTAGTNLPALPSAVGHAKQAYFASPLVINADESGDAPMEFAAQRPPSPAAAGEVGPWGLHWSPSASTMAPTSTQGALSEANWPVSPEAQQQGRIEAGPAGSPAPPSTASASAQASQMPRSSSVVAAAAQTALPAAAEACSSSGIAAQATTAHDSEIGAAAAAAAAASGSTETPSALADSPSPLKVAEASEDRSEEGPGAPVEGPGAARSRGNIVSWQSLHGRHSEGGNVSSTARARFANSSEDGLITVHSDASNVVRNPRTSFANFGRMSFVSPSTSPVTIRDRHGSKPSSEQDESVELVALQARRLKAELRATRAKNRRTSDRASLPTSGEASPAPEAEAIPAGEVPEQAGEAKAPGAGAGWEVGPAGTREPRRSRPSAGTPSMSAIQEESQRTLQSSETATNLSRLDQQSNRELPALSSSLHYAMRNTSFARKIARKSTLRRNKVAPDPSGKSGLSEPSNSADLRCVSFVEGTVHLQSRDGPDGAEGEKEGDSSLSEREPCSPSSDGSGLAEDSAEEQEGRPLRFADSAHSSGSKELGVATRVRSIGKAASGIRAGFRSFTQSVASGAAGVRRSALKSSRHKKAAKTQLLGRRHVRFKGVVHPFVEHFMGEVIKHFRSGSSFVQAWIFFVALITTLDFFLIPLSVVFAALYEAQRHVKTSAKFVLHEEHVGMQLVFFSIASILDTFFVMDMVFQAVQGMVHDLGFQDTTIDKLVDAAPTADDPTTAVDKNSFAHAIATEGVLFGPATRTVVYGHAPVRLLLMSPLWCAFYMGFSRWYLIGTYLLRLYRVRDLISYFAKRQEDLATDVRRVAFFKFAFIIYATSHWLGCIYYFLAAASRFHTEEFNVNWVSNWVTVTYVDFNWRTAGPVYTYTVILFKGFSMLTNLGYESTVPEREEEMLISVISQNVKVIIDAYILGTLFHYVVKKDPEVEAAKELMAALDMYCQDRQLPGELHGKMQEYLKFQQQHSTAVSQRVKKMLPMSLQARLAKEQCGATLHRNMHLFGNCDEQFLGRFMMMLSEVYLMPGEVVIKHGDMARELSFADKGTLVVTDSKDTLVELISGEGLAPCVVGAVSFLMGVPEPYTIKARENEDSSLLSISKAGFDNIIASYPEQNDTIITNMLYQYGLTRDGDDNNASGNAGMGGNAANSDDEGYALLRQSIKHALKRSQESALEKLTFAAMEGDIETTRLLLARGLPINAKDYDGRTTLHLAVHEGRTDVVRVLVDKGARTDVVDTWSRLPLEEALQLDHLDIAEVLARKGARLSGNQFDLVRSAALTDEAKLNVMCIQGGVNPNSSDHDGRTALHLACEAGNLTAVQNLLNVGADVNVTDRWLGTPLEDAIRANDSIIVNLLKRNGARLTRTFQWEALSAAARDGSMSLLILLANSGAQLGMTNYDRMSAAHIAAREGQILVLHRLLYECVEVNQVDTWGYTAMDHAVLREQWACVVLLDHGGGVCNSPVAQAVLNDSQAKLPPLKRVKDALQRAFNSTLPELALLSADLSNNDSSSHDYANLKHLLKLSLQGLESQRFAIEDIVALMDELGTAASVLVRVLSTGFSTRTVGRSLSRQLSRQVNTGAATPDKRGNDQVMTITRTIMRMFMGATLIEATFDALVQLTAAADAAHTNHEDKVVGLFQMLKLKQPPGALSQVEGFDDMFRGQQGYQVLSAIRLVGWVPFRRAILQGEGGKSRRASMAPDGRQQSFTKQMSFNAAGSGGEAAPSTRKSVDMPGADDELSRKDIVRRLDTCYGWIDTLFTALDSDGSGLIGTTESGPLISKALSSMSLSHLWFTLSQLLNQEDHVDSYRFISVCLAWMGIDEAFENRARMKEMHKDETGSVSGSDGGSAVIDLDDADAEREREALASLEEDAEFATIEKHFSRREGLRFALKLTFPEQMLWSFGWRPGRRALATRLFDFLDSNCSGTVSSNALDVLLRTCQQEFMVTKETFTHVEKLKSEINSGRRQGLCQQDVITLFEYMPARRSEHTLPPSAPPFVLHPHSRFLKHWDLLIRSVAVYFFWEVPFNIAFRAGERLGLQYELANGFLEGLLLVDMFINICRAFFSDKGVLIYDPKAIRMKYISESFFLDLVAAMPIEYLVLFNGHVNQGYTSWLRLPKMLRVYRLLRLYSELQRSTNRTSVAVGIIRLIPLVICLTHVYACIWWYIGTVGEPRTIDKLMEEVQPGAHLPARWPYFYEGMGVEYLWTDSTSIIKQYLFSFYWMASTLSTASLVGMTTPKNAAEIAFTILAMLTTLTVYAYVMGEISNLVMSNDEALVQMRQEVALVQTFINKRRLPRELAADIVIMFYDKVNASQDTERVFHMLSSSLRVEVAMHISLPLVKSSDVFAGCTSGFTASLAVLMREVTMTGDETIFRTNEVCSELYIVATNTVNIFTRGAEGQDQLTATRGKGELLGELSFFFRLRHVYTALVGKGTATLFVLSYDDYSQLTATYVDDAACVIEKVIAMVDRSGMAGKSQTSTHSYATVDSQMETNTNVRKTIDTAIRRQTDRHIVTLLQAAAKNDIKTVNVMITDGIIEVDDSDYGMRTAVHMAATNGHLQLLQTLIEQHGACRNLRDRYGGTPLDDAIRCRHIGIVKYLVERSKGSDVDLAQYTTRYIEAAAANDVQMVEILIAAGIQSNVSNADARTALHVAVSNDARKVIEFLLSLDDIELGPLDRVGHTPLWDAIEGLNRDVALMLYQAGAPLQSEIATRVCQEAASNNVQFLELLLRCDVAMTCKDPYGRTPLHAAATNAAHEVVLLILKHDSRNVNMVDIHGQTPLDNAIAKKHTPIAAMLEAAGALPGSHASLEAEVEAMKVWERDRAEAMAHLRHDTIMGSLPELQVLDQSRAAGLAIQRFVERIYTNMQIFFSAFQQVLSQIQASGSKVGPKLTTRTEARLKASLKALIDQFTEIQEILRAPTKEWAVLKSFILRTIGGRSFASVMKTVNDNASEVVRGLRETSRKVSKGSFTLPDDAVKQVRRILAVGPYRYFSQPLPECASWVREEDLLSIRTCDRSIIRGIIQPEEKDKIFLPLMIAPEAGLAKKRRMRERRQRQLQAGSRYISDGDTYTRTSTQFSNAFKTRRSAFFR